MECLIFDKNNVLVGKRIGDFIYRFDDNGLLVESQNLYILRHDIFSVVGLSPRLNLRYPPMGVLGLNVLLDIGRKPVAQMHLIHNGETVSDLQIERFNIEISSFYLSWSGMTFSDWFEGGATPICG